MRLLMVTGDRQVAIGEKGPFWAMQREFSRHFERIDVLCPRPDRPVVETTFFDRVHFHVADVSRAWMVRWIERTGARLVAEHRPALITSHDYGWFYNGLGSWRVSLESGVPYLSEIHHVPGYPRAAGLRERLDRELARRYVRWARTRAVGFRVVNANQMPDLLERWGVPRERIHVIPSLYIDLETFRPAIPRPAPRQDVVFVGRMVANKGLDRIVDALALCARRGRRLTALFVGKGPALGRTLARARRRGVEALLGHIEWVATPAELAAIYRESRVCVCASTCEGGPRFTVEAMACGTPVVSTPVGVMEELLADGAAGRLVGFDVESLADGLLAVTGDESARRAMGEQAVRRAQRHEYRAAIANYARALKQLAGEPQA